jgi:perosamine synthetase
MPEDIIPVSKPSLGREELLEVKKVFNSSWLGLGKWVKEFECRLREFLGAPHVIAVNSGTSALHLALESLDIKKDDEVIVPSLTFVATVQAIIMAGAKPVFCDIEEETLNMDVLDASSRITPRTKAIMPVHYGGFPCDMEKIFEIAKKRKVKVVEDAAHAFGSYYKGKKIGSFGDIICFSFDPIKNITCGEGGVIATTDDEIARTIYKKRILGISNDTWSRYKHDRDWFYAVTTNGFRYHMSNINAAIGIAQLAKLEKFSKERRLLAKKYDAELGKVDGVVLLERDYDNIVPFNYVIRAKNRDDLMKYLKEQGIDSAVHYIPNHLQRFFANNTTKLPVTENVWQELITLPLYCGFTEDQSRVINAVKDFYSRSFLPGAGAALHSSFQLQE